MARKGFLYSMEQLKVRGVGGGDDDESLREIAAEVSKCFTTPPKV